MEVKEHYDKHLGNFYSWMIGNFQQKSAEQEEILKSFEIRPFNNKIALDLGSGNGIQAVPLAKLGFTVKAVDFNKQLLNELYSNKGPLPIEVLEEDILTYLTKLEEKVELIVCMGDTLTHLKSIVDVETLIKNASERLISGGKIILSFRDLTQELAEEQRFIPVRNDENRILTCFLEYFASHVQVYDLLHEKVEGKWIQKVSSYAKLRISEKQIIEILDRYDLKLIHAKTINRMIYLISEKDH